MPNPTAPLRPFPSGPPAADARPPHGGIGRKSSPAAERVSDDLRRHDDDLLTRRRRIAGLSLLASAAMAGISAYQSGLVRHLPEPPLPLFDADRVDASGEAYRMLHAPDGALGLASYAGTLVLATIGSRDRAETLPVVPLAMALKIAVDALSGLYLTAEQGVRHRRFCSWCLTATAASLAMVPQVLPEARMALGRLRNR